MVNHPNRAAAEFFVVKTTYSDGRAPSYRFIDASKAEGQKAARAIANGFADRFARQPGVANSEVSPATAAEVAALRASA